MCLFAVVVGSGVHVVQNPVVPDVLVLVAAAAHHHHHQDH